MMNDQMKLLAEQAGFTVENGHIQSLAYKQTEKLAELIIAECAGFLRDTLDDHFAAEQLEQHFGVE